MREKGTADVTEKLTSFDPAQGLTSEEAIAAFMAEAALSGDAGYIAHAAQVVARARQMIQAATKTESR